MMPTESVQNLMDARPIAIAEIAPSSYNTRKIFDQVKLEELAQSIRSNRESGGPGIIQPLLVRKNPKPEGAPYELVAGERRLRAAKLAGLGEVPAIVQQLDDAQVIEDQVIENAQREDLHPLEEAQGFAQCKAKGATDAELAKKIGKDRTHVSRRLQLLNLIPAAQQVFLRNGILPKHALMIARLPQEEQWKALFYVKSDDWHRSAERGPGVAPVDDKILAAPEYISPSDLATFIDDVIMRPLSRAPWSKKDAKLVEEAGACNTCSKRTGANTLLFDEEGAKNDRCLDGACYEKKFQAHLVQLKAKTEEKGAEVLQVHDSDVRYGGRYAEVHGEKCAHEVKGILLDGHRRGEVIRVCGEKSCKQHHVSPSSSVTANEKARERKLQIDRKYREQLWLKTCREIKSPELEDLRVIAIHMWDRDRHDLKSAYLKARGIEAPKSVQHNGRNYDLPVTKLLQAMKTSKELLVWMASFALFRDVHVSPYGKTDTKDALHRAAERYKVNAKQLRAEIEAELKQKDEKKAESAKKRQAKSEKAKQKGAKAKA